MVQEHRPQRGYLVLLGVVFAGIAGIGVAAISEGVAVGWLCLGLGGIACGVLLYQGLAWFKTIRLDEAGLQWGRSRWTLDELSVGPRQERTAKGLPIREFNIVAPDQVVRINSQVYPRWEELYTELVRRC